MEKLYIPYKVRATLYIITLVGTPIVTVLVSNNMLSATVAQVWAAFVTGVGALAAANVSPDTKQ